MSRTRHAAGVLIVALFGLWGCSRAPSADGGAASAEKLKAVESKLARLEDDFRTAASARDQLSKKLIAAEEARTALLKQVERLTTDVQARTTERDQVAGQYRTLKDGLKELLAKAEGESKPESSPTVPLIQTSNNGPAVLGLPELPRVPTPPQ